MEQEATGKMECAQPHGLFDMGLHACEINIERRPGEAVFNCRGFGRSLAVMP